MKRRIKSKETLKKQSLGSVVVGAALDGAIAEGIRDRIQALKAQQKAGEPVAHVLTFELFEAVKVVRNNPGVAANLVYFLISELSQGVGLAAWKTGII